MRHKYGGHGQGTGDSFNFAAHGFTQLSVKRRERFVKENNVGAGNNCSGKTDPLLLSA